MAAVSLARLALCGWLVLLAACSRPTAEPAPSGLAGQQLGDPPGQGLTPVPAVLPDELAGVLRYFRRPGRVEPYRGAILADPVYAYYRDRLFSVAASLVEPNAAPRLRRELETAYGTPVCRQAGGGAMSCLWRLAAVDLVLETPADGPARFMLRSRETADQVMGWRGQAVPLEQGGQE